MKKLALILVLTLLSLLAGAQTLVCTSDAYKVLKMDPASLRFIQVTEIVYDTTVITFTKEDEITVVKQHMNVVDEKYGIKTLTMKYKYHTQPYVNDDHPGVLFIKITDGQKFLKCVILPLNETPDIRFVFELDGEVYTLMYRIINFEGKE